MTLKSRNFSDSAVTDAKFAAGAVTAAKVAATTISGAKLTTTSRTGFIHLPLSTWRIIDSNDLAAIAGTPVYGTIAHDSVPFIERVNLATDKQNRLRWAATSVIEIANDFAYPNDLDDTAAVEFHMLATTGGSTDTFTVGVSYFEGVGDTNAGGSTGSVSKNGTVSELTVSIAAADIGTYPNSASIGLTPAAHANDALYVFATWIEYSRV